MEFAVIVIVASYTVGLPAYVWTRHDLRSIHPHLWDAVGTPHPWRHAITIGYLAAGWPALGVAAVWRYGPTRRRLLSFRRRARKSSELEPRRMD